MSGIYIYACVRLWFSWQVEGSWPFDGAK